VEESLPQVEAELLELFSPFFFDDLRRSAFDEFRLKDSTARADFVSPLPVILLFFFLSLSPLLFPELEAVFDH